jgi:CheY-like chemotaxis protein
VIDAALDSIRPALEAKKIRLKTGFDRNAELIYGDSNRLQQIVWNLLSNAAKFTQPEGEIAVLLKRAGNYAELSFCDSGDGISPDFLPFVFERFTQADGSSTRQYGGLGLGLAITRHLVELHGGSIYAHSEGVGFGSIFTIKLPLAAIQGRVDEPLLPSRGKKSQGTLDIPNTVLSGVKVLVVDDESDARELLKVILAQYGAEVITAESAEEALENLSLSACTPSSRRRLNRLRQKRGPRSGAFGGI